MCFDYSFIDDETGDKITFRYFTRETGYRYRVTFRNHVRINIKRVSETEFWNTYDTAHNY